MKEERIFLALGEADEELLLQCEAAIKTWPLQKKRRWALAGITACLLLAIGAGVTLQQLFSSKGEYPVKYLSTEGNVNSSEEITVVIPWEELTLPEQYTELELNGLQYSTAQTAYDGALGDLLGTAKIVGMDDKGTLQTTEGTVYRLQDMTPEAAVLVEFEKEPGIFYVYGNSLYYPDTLGEFLVGLNLKENLHFNDTIYWKNYTRPDGKEATVEFSGADSEMLWELLFSKTEAVIEKQYDYDPAFMEDRRVLDFSVNVPVLGSYNISIAITENGYLTTNILSTGKAFYIGKDRVQTVLDYVTENCQGYELVYESDTPQEYPSAGQRDDSTSGEDASMAVSSYGK